MPLLIGGLGKAEAAAGPLQGPFYPLLRFASAQVRNSSRSMRLATYSRPSE
jgi:hypothetical protein